MDSERVYVKQVWSNQRGQRLITLPYDCKIESGDYIVFKKINVDKIDLEYNKKEE